MPPPVRDELEGKPVGWAHARWRRPIEIAITRQQYCGSIEAIDDQVGAILDALEAHGFLENTYIVFTSDHGEMLGDHGLYAKSAAYEASLRIPLILAGPNIGPGRISDALVELIDLNPTLLRMGWHTRTGKPGCTVTCPRTTGWTHHTPRGCGQRDSELALHSHPKPQADPKL